MLLFCFFICGHSHNTIEFPQHLGSQLPQIKIKIDELNIVYQNICTYIQNIKPTQTHYNVDSV